MKPSSPPRALLLALAALVALPASLALADAAPTAQAAKRSCRARGHPRARSCRRATRRRSASGGVPRPFTPLWSADRSVNVLVLIQQARGGRPRQIVQIRAGNVPVTCPTSGALRSFVVTQTPLRGSSFSGEQTDPSGARKHVTGHFVSATKAVGTFQVSYADPRGGGDCDSGRVSFTATR